MKNTLTFTLKYIFALFTLGCLSVTAYINLDHLITEQLNDSKIINLSGKQRMLSQKIQIAVISSNLEVLKRSISTMENSHNYLVSLPLSTKIKDMYFKTPVQLDKRVREYLNKAKKINKQGKDSNTIYILQHSNDLLKDFDRLVTMYQLESENKIKKLQSFAISILIISLSLLFLIGFFIFRPANRKFETRAKEIMNEKNYSNVIIESNANAIVAVGEDLKVKTFNKAAESIFGYSKEEMIGKDSLLKIVPKIHHTAYQKGILKHFETGILKQKRMNLELSGVRKNGETFPIRISFGENFNEKESEKIVITNIQDITNEKEKENLLIQNEKIYKDLFELNQSVIMLINPTSGNIVNVNKSGIDFYGYEKSTFLTLNISDINTSPINKIEDAMNLAVKSKKNYFEFEHILASKEIRKVRVHSTPTLYRNEMVLYATVTDITEEHEAKNKLLLLEKEFKDFSDYSKEELEKINIFLNEGQKIANMGSWEVDLITNELIWSDQMYKIFGLEPQEAKVTYEQFLNLIHPEDKEKFENDYSTSLKERKSYFSEHRIIKKDGSIRFVLESCIHKYNKENEVIKLIGIVQDITEKKDKDKMIYQQSKMATMGEMIENIAHQWRQPLSVISTATTGIMFKIELNVLKEEDINSTMNAVNDSVKHLSRTIDDFRDFFKKNKSKSEFKINNTFEKTFKLIVSQFKTANITILKNIEEVTFVGFEHELIQVLINILNNARDELITKENQDKLILIDVVKKDTLLEICIKDNAGGIPLDIINEVFEPHFTTKEETNGTGVGLYMSQLIIKEHMNGILEVNNVDFVYNKSPYIGAEFKISLPLQR